MVAEIMFTKDCIPYLVCCKNMEITFEIPGLGISQTKPGFGAISSTKEKWILDNAYTLEELIGVIVDIWSEEGK